MTLSSGRGQLVRALLEGIAAQVAALADSWLPTWDSP